MIESGKLNGYLVEIKKELRYAERKHPNFCDCYDSDSDATIWNYLETNKSLVKHAQEANDKLTKEKRLGATDILHEEILEAKIAYAEGDLSHCLQELAQCGAVILRTMEFVKNEMEKTK